MKVFNQARSNQDESGYVPMEYINIADPRQLISFGSSLIVMALTNHRLVIGYHQQTFIYSLTS